MGNGFASSTDLISIVSVVIVGISSTMIWLGVLIISSNLFISASLMSTSFVSVYDLNVDIAVNMTPIAAAQVAHYAESTDFRDSTISSRLNSCSSVIYPRALNSFRLGNGNTTLYAYFSRSSTISKLNRL